MKCIFKIFIILEFIEMNFFLNR